MNERLSVFQVTVLCAYALAMAGGQLLLKSAALRVPIDGSIVERAVTLLQNWYFLAALAAYLALAVVWVWILGFTPLSRAYPFVALAFAITPLLGGLWFAEPLSARLLAGIAVIMGGLLLVAG
jgi:drug/metabolite transporter (DMT)-like permease